MTRTYAFLFFALLGVALLTSETRAQNLGQRCAADSMNPAQAEERVAWARR